MYSRVLQCIRCLFSLEVLFNIETTRKLLHQLEVMEVVGRGWADKWAVTWPGTVTRHWTRGFSLECRHRQPGSSSGQHGEGLACEWQIHGDTDNRVTSPGQGCV